MWNLLIDQKIIEGEKKGTSHISKTHAVRMEKDAAEVHAKAEAAKAKAAADVAAATPATEEPAT